MKKLIVVGTGRNGSKNVAATLANMCWDQRVMHEPYKGTVVPHVALYLEGQISVEQLAGKLEALSWPDITVDWALVPVLHLFEAPTRKIVWIKRDREDTINSMVRNGWYAKPEHSNPRGTWWGDGAWHIDHDDWRWRPSSREAAVPWNTQRDRCAWYFDKAYSTLEALDIEYIDITELTPQILEDICLQAGITPTVNVFQLANVYNNRLDT